MTKINLGVITGNLCRESPPPPTQQQQQQLTRCMIYDVFLNYRTTFKHKHYLGNLVSNWCLRDRYNHGRRLDLRVASENTSKEGNFKKTICISKNKISSAHYCLTILYMSVQI